MFVCDVLSSISEIQESLGNRNCNTGSFRILTILHSERPKLYAILAFLSAIGLTEEQACDNVRIMQAGLFLYDALRECVAGIDLLSTLKIYD